MGRVLVIDDNPEVLALLRRVLENAQDPEGDVVDALEAEVFGESDPASSSGPQFLVDAAPSGEAGYDRIVHAQRDRHPYMVAFVDMRMPEGWDGLETIEALWRVDPRLQVVICTAYIDYPWGAISARLGDADRWLILKKPFERIEVLQAACALADKWSLEREREGRLEALERRLAEQRERLQAAWREREAVERELRHLATHDALTGLPNRSLLSDRLRQAVAGAAAGQQRLAVLLLNLDRFKYVNESLGHCAGDQLLRAVTARLESLVGAKDTVARLGADEFVLLVSDVPHAEAVAQLAQSARAAIAQPLETEGHVLHVNASVGVSLYPEDGADAAGLLMHADTALRSAKSSTEGVRFFSRELGLRAQESVALGLALRRALEEQEFELHYQPQVELRSGKIVGVEALIRWHRGGELLLPDRFIPLAEELGLIEGLGEWVLRSACVQAKAWHAAGHSDLVVAVNISARQLARSALPETVQRVLAETCFPAERLELELTESAFMEAGNAAARTLASVRALGVRLSLDDFGTGYSSLSYLKRFPVSSVKIDKSFIKDVTCDVGGASLTAAILAMARSLNLRTVAEGVETAGQLEFLYRHRCDTIQGFLFSPPVSAPEMTQRLRADERLVVQKPGDTAAQRTLLLVDDEPNVLNALTRVLRRDGYRILCATTPHEAFELLALHRVGVVVCDGRMPEMSGVEVLKRVKEIYPATVRVMLSGYTKLDAVTEAINRGAVYRFLTKPWEDQSLRESIAEAFRRHDLQSSNDAGEGGAPTQ